MCWSRSPRDFTLLYSSANDASAQAFKLFIDSPQANHYDAIILAVAHEQFVALGASAIKNFGTKESVLYDIKSILPKDSVDARL